MRSLVVRCEDQVLRFPLPAGEIRVGSDRDNEIVLPFAGISRLHARIGPARGGLLVIDSNSKNGIFLNGQRVTEAILSESAVVEIGRAVRDGRSVSLGGFRAGQRR